MSKRKAKLRACRIPLTQGFEAIVDEEDYLRVAQFKWHVHRTPTSSTLYAIRNVQTAAGRWTTEKMHRVLFNVTNPKVFIDHINGDGLDNRKENLRLSSNQQNSFNRRFRKDNALGIKNVLAFTRPSGAVVFDSYIKVAPLVVHLGRFKEKKEAALAYDRAARRAFGRFAWLNFPNITDYSNLPPCKLEQKIREGKVKLLDEKEAA